VPATPFIIQLFKDLESDRAAAIEAAYALEGLLDKSPSFRKTPGLVATLADCSQSSCADIRFHCATMLGKSCDPSAFDALVKLLNDTDPNVRVRAIAALGDLGDSRGEAVIIREVVRKARQRIDEYGGEIYCAQVAIGKIGAGKDRGVKGVRTVLVLRAGWRAARLLPCLAHCALLPTVWCTT
jgi:hypothetical protein